MPRERARSFCVYWVVRAGAFVLLLVTLGVGFSFALAILFLCAGAVAGALLIGPAGAATQGGAGAAVLVASGVDVAQAIDVAVAGQGLGVLAGGAILLFAALWHTGGRLAIGFAPRRLPSYPP